MNEGQARIVHDRETRYESIFDELPDGLIISERDSGTILRANPAACRMHGYPPAQFGGLQLGSLIHPDSQAEFDRRLRVFGPDRLISIESRHVRADGSTFYAEWHATATTYEGRECWLGIVRDVTERMEAEQVMLQHVAARTREQAALLEMSRTLAATLEFQPRWILEQLRKIVEYNTAGFFMLEGPALVAVAMRGTPELEQTAPFSIHPQGSETLASIFGAHRPIIIADWRAETQQARLLRGLLKEGAASLLEGVQSWMWVPLTVKRRLIGGVGLGHERSDFFTADHAALALSVANQAAITAVNAELYQNAQTLAALQERQRLAQNLHDAVNQSLFSAGLIAEVLPRIWDQGQDIARQSLEELNRLTRGAMAEMRALLAELRPSTLTDADLGELLHLLGNAFAGRTNIPTKVTITGEGSLPPDVQVTLYRICQEAINNIAKHAQAHTVNIVLRHEGSGVELQIIDDGRGFDPAETASGHYGLSMMRERAEGIGALLEINSSPGHGSELRIHWPKDAAEEVE